MGSRIPNVIVRAIRLAPMVVCLFAGCTCSHKPVSSPSARGPLCEKYVAALSGSEKDRAWLDNPEVQALAAQVPDLVMCGAVVRDSDAPCRQLMPNGRGPSMVCRRMWSIFHELQTHPKGRSFLFGEIDWEECHQPSQPSTVCDSLLAAMRSGDAHACAQAGDMESICRAFINLDKSLCRIEGNRKGGDDKGYGVEQGADEFCKKTIESRAFLAQGLEALAESGPPRERELAKAALGRPGACGRYAQSAMDLCLANPPARMP